MFFKEPKPCEERIKRGFAWLPVTADNGTVWLAHYELTQSWNWQYSCWDNDYV